MSDLPVFDIAGDLPAAGTTTLLEASAGTGKTWTIGALVTRLVAEGHGRLEEMLIVTFGRAASQELRERVRAQLVVSEAVLDAALAGTAPQPDRLPDQQPDQPPDPLSTLLCEVAHPELRERRDRLRLALTSFDSATIATTHQFCQLVLRSLGVAGDTDAGATLVENLDDLLVEVVDDLYVRGFARSEDDPVFNRSTALALARQAVGDPQATLVEPPKGDDDRPHRTWRFACAVRAEMEVRKRRLGVLSYDDLLSRLAQALERDDAPARLRMRDRWRFVLVDEFQDTDPVQWEVLDSAFSGHATMVLIGDPKQAIYAFRGGDVVTYLAAGETATSTATLGTNFRSDEALLRSAQALLRGAALGEERIVVRDVAAHHTGRRLEGAPHPAPFRLRLVDRARFGVPPSKGVGIGKIRDLVNADLGRDVRALLTSGATYDGRPLGAGDVAVLCETRSQCEHARTGLVAAGVDAVIAGSGSVYATEGADEWLCLLEAMEQPHRSARIRAAALTAFFGHTAADLDTEGETLTDQVGETVRGWADLLRTRGVAAVHESAVSTHDLFARVLARPRGERLMTDLRHVGESLHDVATRDHLGLPALLTWMRQRLEETRKDGAEERTRRLDSDAAAVQILTIHGSKGLQFPVVYLPFVADLWPRTPSCPLFHDDDGRRCLDVSGSGAFTDRAVQEESGEDLRLLYVAMTRAQSQLVTWWFPSDRNTRTAPLHRMLMGRGPDEAGVPASAALPSDDDARATADRWEAAGGPVVETIEAVVPTYAPLDRAVPDLEARTWTRVVDQAWRRTSYTGLSSAAEALTTPPSVAFGSEPEAVPKTDEPEIPALSETGSDGPDLPSPMADLPVGATFGSLVHAVLEHTDPAAPDHSGDLRAELVHHIAQQRLRWPVELDADELADALVAVCDTPLGPLAGGVTLRQVGVADRLCELDFELPLAGGDTWRVGDPEPTLADLAPILRAHLPDGDPLLPYADVLETRGYAAQELRGYLAGSVDVVLRVGDPTSPKFLVVDYKTNHLGPLTDPPTPLTAGHYTPERLAAAMTHSSYPLQALLYAVVAHRFLRWRLRGYEPEEHLGGVLCLYLRGMCGADTPVVGGQPCGVFSWRPPVALVVAVSDLLDAREEMAS